MSVIYGYPKGYSGKYQIEAPRSKNVALFQKEQKLFASFTIHIEFKWMTNKNNEIRQLSLVASLRFDQSQIHICGTSAFSMTNEFFGFLKLWSLNLIERWKYKKIRVSFWFKMEIWRSYMYLSYTHPPSLVILKQVFNCTCRFFLAPALYM